jgi:hypothetical protein
MEMEKTAGGLQLPGMSKADALRLAGIAGRLARQVFAGHSVR